MQDRFRFRVWNIKEKEMIYNAEIAYDGMNYNTEWQLGKNKNDGWVDCFGYYLDYPEEYVIMQCTGLKDKNGMLIYEGDINIINEGFRTVIEWDGEHCAFAEKATNVLGREKIFYPLFDSTDEGRNHRMEIIGNIYENKELL